MISTRRDRVGLPRPSDDDFVGLALSGGGMRSACFSIGVVQALHKVGLWRYVDYLSTVSGGSYLGSFLTSSSLRDQRAYGKNDFPLQETTDKKQCKRVQRLIYGGNYLFKPWEFANKYLIGLVLMNVAIGSAIVAVCAAIAFLWRCLDYPWLVDRASLLMAPSDLSRPFWPFIVLGTLWCVAWLASFYRRGAEARGRIARILLLLTVASFFIGIALLIGNGDIALGGFAAAWLGEEPWKIEAGVWGPFVALILGGLIPFLRPKRLLESGIRPSAPWERVVFRLATASLLVGLPLIIVGLLARENISGYNDHPNRPMVKEDIDDWSAVCELLLKKDGAWIQSITHRSDRADSTPGTTDADTPVAQTSPNWEFLLPLRHAAATLWGGALLPAPGDVADQQSGAAITDNPPQRPRQVSTEPANTLDADIRATLDVIDSDWQRQDFVKANGSSWLFPYLAVGQNLNPSNALQLNNGGQPRKPNETFRYDLLRYLPALVRSYEETEITDDALARQIAHTRPENRQKPLPEAQLLHHAHLLRVKLHEMGSEESDLNNAYEWVRWRLPQFVSRLVGVTEMLLGLADDDADDRNDIRDFWRLKILTDHLKDDLCGVMNDRFLGDVRFLEILKNGRSESVQTHDRRDSPSTSAGSDSLAAGVSGAGRPTDRADTPDSKRLRRLSQRASIEDLRAWQPHEIAEYSRLLLEKQHPTLFRDRSVIQRRVSIYEDQWARLKWLGYALVVLFAVGIWVDVNATSLHGFHRNRIDRAFIVGRREKAANVPLSAMKTAELGGPYHLINASVGLFRRRLPEAEQEVPSLRDDDDEREHRWVDTFLFSQLFCGSEITGYAPTLEYEKTIRGELNQLDLAEATALSGAAVSPGHVRNWLLAFLMLALNLRLGQWLPNPDRPAPWMRPRVGVLFRSLWKNAKDRAYCFVSDGGSSDNLGLVQLLKRRCSLIIVSDASYDPKHNFPDLARAVRHARVHGGVKIVDSQLRDGDPVELVTLPLRLYTQKSSDSDERNDGSHRNQRSSDVSTSPQTCEDHYFVGRIIYPEGKTGLLVYLKASLTGDEGPDIQQYQAKEKEFPHQSTNDQLYDEEQVELYRRLGQHIGERVCERLNSVDLWEEKLTTLQLLRLFSNDQVLSDEETRAAADQILHSLRKRHAHDGFEEQDADFIRSAVRNACNGIGLSTLSPAVVERIKNRRLKADERKLGIWLLLGRDTDAIGDETLDEWIQILIKIVQEDPAASVRIAAADVLGIWGRANSQRSRVRSALRSAISSERSGRVKDRLEVALANLARPPK